MEARTDHDGRPNPGLIHLEDLRREAQHERAARENAVSWRRRAAQALLALAGRLEPELIARGAPTRHRA